MGADIPPQPFIDPDSLGFWEATARDTLALQFCMACARYQFPPLEACRACGEALAWRSVSGSGSVHSFIIQHHSVAPGFADKRPYAIGLVSPDEAPHVRLPAEIRCLHQADLRIGATVNAMFQPLAGGKHKVAVFVVDPKPH